MPDGISRRNFAKYAGAMGAAGMAGCLGDDSDDGDDTTGDSADVGDTTDDSGPAQGERPFRWIGDPTLTFAEQVEKFADLGVENEVTQGTLTGVTQEVLTGANETHDAVANSAHVVSAAILANPTTVPIPVDDLDKWEEGRISDVFLNPEEGLPGLGEVQAGKLAMHLFNDPETRDELLLPPQVFQLNGLAINPAEVSTDTNEWSALFDDQFAGETILCDVPIIGGLEAMMHCADNDIIDIGLDQLNDPSEEQIDELIDFLIAEKQAGQFRTTWEAPGESINIFASGEAVVGDIWPPAIYGTRREGVPCTNVEHGDNTIQGEMMWYAGIAPLAPGVNDRNNYNEVLSLIEDVHWGAWYPGFIALAAGYQAPNFVDSDLVRDGSDETGDGMGPELYDWLHEGEATYEAIDDPYLFDPVDYDWSMEEDSPSSDGQVRGGGSFHDRLDRTRSMWIWPENGEYYLNAWADFQAA